MKNLILVLFILSPLVGCGGGTSDPDYVAEGWDAFTIGDLSRAHDQFATAYLKTRKTQRRLMDLRGRF